MDANLPGIDSFAITKVEDVTFVIVFRFTILTNHPSNARIIRRLRQKVEEDVTRQRVEMALVFVVPSDLAGEYKEQAWSGGSKSFHEDVTQYVCGLADEDLEGAIKSGIEFGSNVTPL